ncbi:MAG: phage terminase large subunit family protein [Dehalococcoidia bacterium]|nr:phage terminase large subunit family protein [Dehalococcoidia bacterium]
MNALNDSPTKNSEDSSKAVARVQQLARRELAKRNPNDPLVWAEAFRTLHGRPFVVPPPLRDIYREPHPFTVVQKPAQVGVTEMMMNFALWAASTQQGGRGNVLHLMPTQQNVERLSQGRLAAAIAESPALRRLASRARDGQPTAQRALMRTIGPGTIYLSGSDQASQYTGIDADLVILDEFDLMKDEVLSQAIPRLRSSHLNRLWVASTPTIPEFGVNALLGLSDERHYELQCPSCRAWVDPQYPENVDFERGVVVCHCGGALDPYRPGRWVPMRPEVKDIRGYQLNRLVFPLPRINDMRLAASGNVGMNQEQFWRQDLGMPFVAADSRLSAADLDFCQAGEPSPDQVENADSVVMGIDVGQNCFWIVIRVFLKQYSYPIFVERFTGGWEDVDELCRRFRVRYCVVDAQPDTRGARAFHRRMARRGRTNVFLAYYRQQGAHHEFVWGRDAHVSAVRTLSLDETFGSFRARRSTLPANARELAGGAYYEHMQALVRTTAPDDFGQPIPAYRHTRPDDFAHAENYITLIATRFGRYSMWWD